MQQAVLKRLSNTINAINKTFSTFFLGLASKSLVEKYWFHEIFLKCHFWECWKRFHRRISATILHNYCWFHVNKIWVLDKNLQILSLTLTFSLHTRFFRHFRRVYRLTRNFNYKEGRSIHHLLILTSHNSTSFRIHFVRHK